MVIPSLTAVNAASAPFLILSQSKVNTPAITSPAPLATPIRVLKLFTNVPMINPPTAFSVPNNPVKTPAKTPTVLDSTFITVSLSSNPITKSANAIAIGSNTANKAFIIFSNASLILFNLACPSSVLLRDSFNAKNAVTIRVTTPKATLNPVENRFNPSLNVLIAPPAAPNGPGKEANWSSN